MFRTNDGKVTTIIQYHYFMLQKWFVIHRQTLTWEALEPSAGSALSMAVFAGVAFLLSCFLLPISFVPEIRVLDKCSFY